MNATDSTAIVDRFLDALSAHDDEAALACLDDDVARDVEGGGREIGREKFRWYLGLRARWFDERIADRVVMAEGVHAAAEVTLKGTYLSPPDGWPPASGQSYSLPAVFVFEIDDGLISRFTLYRDVARWQAELRKAGG